jgi:hypothetical protein
MKNFELRLHHYKIEGKFVLHLHKGKFFFLPNIIYALKKILKKII